MKKIFTLLAATTIIATSFAQNNFNQRNNGYNRGNDYAMNNNRNSGDRFNNNYYADRDRDFYVARDREIAMINREFDHKIWEINGRLFMPRFKKDYIIHQLNDQRRIEIANVFAKYNNRGRFDNDCRRH